MRLEADEIEAVRNLKRDLELDGYLVDAVELDVALKDPVAHVRRDLEKSVTVAIRSARKFLRAVEGIELEEGEFVVDPEEYETLVALASTMRTIERILRCSRPRTVGGLAHVDFAFSAKAGSK